VEPARAAGAATEDASMGASELLDDALDALGAVLRAFGRHAFSLEETTATELGERYERWARHVLNGAPPPDATEASKRRDFRTLQRDFAERRKAEAEHVRRVRDLIWDVMNGVRRALSHDAVADARLREPLDRLRRVVSSEATMAELRSEVGAAVAVIEQTLADRKDAKDVELRGMGQALRSAKSELFASQSEGEIDPLTQVFTRSSFDKHIENAASLADLTGERLALLVVDADRFKFVNELAGREAGDRALRAIADATVRVASRSTDYVARLGSDEFAVVLGDTSLAEALKVAERMLDAARRVTLPGKAVDRGITVSIGVAERRGFEACAGWLERGLASMKQAKVAGGDRSLAAQEP